MFFSIFTSFIAVNGLNKAGDILYKHVPGNFDL